MSTRPVAGHRRLELARTEREAASITRDNDVGTKYERAEPEAGFEPAT